MDRKDFGLWGLELTPEDFAKALAALGVFQASIDQWPSSLSIELIKKTFQKPRVQSKGILPWRLNVVEPAKLDQLKPANTAHLFAEAWNRFAKSHRGPMVFELHLDRLGDYFWIADKLLSPAVKTLNKHDAGLLPEIARTALYVRVDKPETVVGWNWPLRLGFMTDDASKRLRQQLEKGFNTTSLKELVTFVELVKESDECDLLLFPQDVRGVLSELLKVEWRPRADCVLVLGGGHGLSGRLTALVQAVRIEARTSGVGLLSVAEDQRVPWLKGLIAELSHNNSLERALFLVEQEPSAPPPLLACSRNLIELTLVSRTATRLSRELNRTLVESIRADPPQLTGLGPFMKPGADPSGPALEKLLVRERLRRPGVKKNGGGTHGFAGGAKGGFGGAAGGRPPAAPLPPRATVAKISNTLERMNASDFTRESGGATEVVRNRFAAETLTKKIPRKQEDRRIQAQVFDTPANKQTRRALKPGTSYAVDVRIGPPDAKWETAEKELPMDQLPPSEKGHDLTVVFAEPKVSPEPQVGKLFLPPHGPTVPCRFYFHTTDSLEAVSARITVLHRNRVIQTAILEAPVSASRTPKNAKIKVRIEARVVPNINDLRERQTFDTALVLNHANNGQAYGTGMSGERAVMFSLDEDGLKQTIQTLNDELTNIADDPESFSKDIADEATTSLLRTLAIHGRLLYKTLFVYRPENEWIVGKDKKRIQIISTRLESNLPLEFLYDYEAPNEKAKLCPYAKKSLPKGECDKACGGPKKKQNIVCPLGFWGLNRVIERYAYDGSRNLQGNTYALQAASIMKREPLQVLDRALFAASGEVDRAKKGTIGGLEKLLKEKAKQADYVTSWSQWVTKAKTNPTLLLLLSHTEVDPLQGNLGALEIAKLPRLRVVDIDEKHVRKPHTKAKPIVMLIGCKTNAPDNALHSFVPAFSRYSAIVLSTGSTVLALQAAQVAAELVRALSALPKNKETTFGDVMLEIRRKLLAKGLPMVLCLSAYGDTDWKLQ